MKRRRFLKISALGVTGSLFLPGAYKLMAAPPGDSAPTVWELQGDPAKMIPDLFQALGGISALTNKDPAQLTVLIKPNLCLPHPPEMGTTVSPEVISALCRYFSELGVKKLIFADHTLKGAAAAFLKTGVVQEIKKHPGARWVFADRQRFYAPVPVDGKILKETELLKLTRRADLVINLATAKHHTATQVSLCVKNLMGFIWERASLHTDMDLSGAIGDLVLAIRPTLNLIDARRVLLNGGPTGPGTVVKENRLFAGFDPVTVDAVVVSRYNFGDRQLSAKEVGHLWAAYQNGVGEIDLNKIHLQKIKS